MCEMRFETKLHIQMKMESAQAVSSNDGRLSVVSNELKTRKPQTYVLCRVKIRDCVRGLSVATIPWSSFPLRLMPVYDETASGTCWYVLVHASSKSSIGASMWHPQFDICKKTRLLS
jgi:hypothetical protein